MNLVKNYQPDPINTDNSAKLLKAAESGKAIICTGMAILFRHVLHAVGIKSRSVLLRTNIFNANDNHETVEVLLDGKWIVMDPTFNISLTDSEGQLLSALEVKQLLIKGKHKNISIKFYGEVSYPIRVDNYYIDYLFFFNNIFIIHRSDSKLFKVPPLSYWYGQKLYYEKLSQESISHVTFWEQIYLMAIIILPTVLFIIILLFIVGVLTK
jgi:hypothetical protein